MTIPVWIVNTFAIIGFMTLWSVIAAFVALNLAKFMKEDDCGN